MPSLLEVAKQTGIQPIAPAPPMAAGILGAPSQRPSLLQIAQQQGIKPQAPSLSTPQKEKEGEGIARFIPQVFKDVAGNVAGALEAGGDVAAGLAWRALGDKDRAQASYNQAQQALESGGALGKAIGAKPIGLEDNLGESYKRMVGAGAEIAPYLFAPSAAAGILGKGGTIAGKVAQGAGLGSLSGGLGSFGSSLNRGESVIDAIKSVPGGALAGGALGAALPGVGSALGSAAKGVTGAAKKTLPSFFSKFTQSQGTKAPSVVGSIAKDVYESAKGFGKRSVERATEKATTAQRLQTLPKTIQEAVRTGVDERLATDLAQMGAENARRTLKMIDIAEKAGTYTKKQPKEVVGEAIIERGKQVVKERANAGKNLQKIRESLPIKPMDASPIFGKVKEFVEQRGGVIRNGELDIRNSTITATDKKLIDKLLYDLRPNTRGQILRSPKYLDSKSSRLFKEFKLAQKSDKPFGTDAQAVVELIRKETANQLDTIIPGYTQALQRYAQVMDMLEEMVSYLGLDKKELTRLGLDNPETLSILALRSSEKAMRNLGNAASKSREFFDALDKTSRSFGYKGEDELDKLIRNADIVEDLFGSTQTRTLQSNIEQGIGSATGADVLEAGIGGIRTGGLIGGAASTIQKLGKAERKHQIEAIKKLLGELAHKQR